MKTIVCTKYGPPEVLPLKDVPKPIPNLKQATRLTALSGKLVMVAQIPSTNACLKTG